MDNEGSGSDLGVLAFDDFVRLQVQRHFVIRIGEFGFGSRLAPAAEGYAGDGRNLHGEHVESFIAAVGRIVGLLYVEAGIAYDVDLAFFLVFSSRLKELDLE